MAHEIESCFVTRTPAWHNLGTIVKSSPTSADAIHLAGLDWDVVPQPIFLADGTKIEGSVANVRTSDNKALGVVGERYQIVQNSEAFSFTDSLLGEGVKYESAGSLKGGRTIWLLAKLPDKFEILGEKVDPYVVFTNTHDGSGAVKVAATNVRVVCNNTLNMALRSAKRTWSTRHTGNMESKLQAAQQTLELAEAYMEAQKDLFENLYQFKMDYKKVDKTIELLVPITEAMTDRQKENAQTIRNDIFYRYHNAPDLTVLDNTGARFVQAVADTASHIVPFRHTKDYKENKFKKMIEGNDLLDRAVDIVLAA